MAERKKTTIIKKDWTLKEFAARRNEVLFHHELGGLGDVIMHRMLFDDCKRIMPDGKFFFSCLPEYLEVAQDHPNIYKVLNSKEVNPNEYLNYFNTCVTVANRYEIRNAPSPDNRADIWAKYCGITLKSHEMNFNLSQELLDWGKQKIQQLRSDNKPVVLLASVSKIMTKTLFPQHIEWIQEATQHCTLIGLHKERISNLNTLTKLTIPQWMACIAAADYIISVDTAAFHLAGGMKKPLTGIFTFADGKTYGKYFDFVLVQKHRDNGNWSCGPCFKFGECPKCPTHFKPCLTELTKEEIQTGIAEMFRRWPWK